MKGITKTVLVLVLLITLCPFSFGAKRVTDTNYGITADLPDNTTVITADTVDLHAELLYKLGKTSQEMQALFNEQGYVFYAFSNDERNIISLSVIKTGLSEAVTDLISLPDEQLAEVKRHLCGSVLETAEKIDEIEQRGALFFRIVSTDAASGLPSVYYITILNGYCCMLSLDSMVTPLSGNSVSMIDTVFGSLGYTVLAEKIKAEQKSRMVMEVLSWIGIAVAAAAAVLIILSITRDLHKRKMETNWQRKIRKKPRR